MRTMPSGRCAAGLAIVEAVAELVIRPDVELEARVGIATGRWWWAT